MRIERFYTKAGLSPYSSLAFKSATSEIKNPDGSIVFRLENIEVPDQFSQVAADVLAQKYFRKAGVPARLKKVEENDVPSFLWRSEPDEKALAKLPETERYGSEMSAKQVFDRLAGCWTYWGWKGGYFKTEEDAQAFFDEQRYMLARQMVAPNSPQWFNTGLHWAYGIDGPGQGHFYVDYKTGKLTASKSSYEHPQPHACFIQSVADDLVNKFQAKVVNRLGGLLKIIDFSNIQLITNGLIPIRLSTGSVEINPVTLDGFPPVGSRRGGNPAHGFSGTGGEAATDRTETAPGQRGSDIHGRLDHALA